MLSESYYNGDRLKMYLDILADFDKGVLDEVKKDSQDFPIVVVNVRDVRFDQLDKEKTDQVVFLEDNDQKIDLKEDIKKDEFGDNVKVNALGSSDFLDVDLSASSNLCVWAGIAQSRRGLSNNRRDWDSYYFKKFNKEIDIKVSFRHVEHNYVSKKFCILFVNMRKKVYDKQDLNCKPYFISFMPSATLRGYIGYWVKYEGEKFKEKYVKITSGRISKLKGDEIVFPWYSNCTRIYLVCHNETLYLHYGKNRVYKNLRRLKYDFFVADGVQLSNNKIVLFDCHTIRRGIEGDFVDRRNRLLDFVGKYGEIYDISASYFVRLRDLIVDDYKYFELGGIVRVNSIPLMGLIFGVNRPLLMYVCQSNLYCCDDNLPVGQTVCFEIGKFLCYQYKNFWLLGPRYIGVDQVSTKRQIEKNGIKRPMDMKELLQLFRDKIK